ncbi:uncharacterized protein LOC122054122 [Zingiber officinale]|uniref:Uncharacterized protein n=1 Tax=Zingiber officinale TaxID=94328 RepID=A0A8J5HRN6_ZINOF|nr:uncharacterized protein LOC122054122 [Zingiber officinale]KAG6522287.1 hypothetical protein ZIOFF_019425 [Zingiber officinale]
MASARLLLLSAALLFHYFAACAPLPSRDSCLDVSPAERQRCDVSSIRVRQTNRGRRRGGATMDPVFEVEVENGCCCAVSRVVLVSEGFASSVPVDPRLFRREEGGGGYLVADGREIPSSGSLTFRYAWDRAFFMYPASLESNCSALAKQREAISVDEN